MDINHIELSPFLVTSLYRTSLIETDKSLVKFDKEPGEIKKDAKTNSWNSFGSNRKNILLILQTTEALHIPDTELHFLMGMLSACKLDMNDVALVNLNNHPGFSYKELINYFKSRVVFLFGIDPPSFGLPISFPHFQLQPFSNCSFLFTPTLKELENDKILKSKLWVCLRRIFAI